MDITPDQIRRAAEAQRLGAEMIRSDRAVALAQAIRAERAAARARFEAEFVTRQHETLDATSPAQAIEAARLADKLVAVYGSGFNPDRPASDYNPPLRGEAAWIYETRVAELFGLPGNPYLHTKFAMQRRGLMR